MPFTVARSIEAYRPSPGDDLGIHRVVEAGASQREYIISDDLADTVDLLSLPLRFPNRVPERVLTQVKAILYQGLVDAMPQDRVNFLNVPSMREDLTRKAKELQNKFHAAIITMDTHYVAPDDKNRIFPLQTSRIYDDVTGHYVGRGPRPFYSSLETQIDEIIADAKGKPVILAESGLSSGGTVRMIIEMLKQKGVETKALCVGLGEVEAMIGLLHDYPDLEVHALVGLHNVIDWTELKDLLAFVPDSGQTVGRRSKEGLLLPLYHHRLITGYTIPYPLGRIKRWTALSDEGAALMRVAGLRASLALFKGVEQANGGKHFTFDDLLSLNELTRYRVKVTLPWFLAGFGGIAREIYEEVYNHRPKNASMRKKGDDEYRRHPKIARMRIVDLLDRILQNTYKLENGHEILLPEDITYFQLFPGGNETILVKTFVDRPAYPEVAKRLLAAHKTVEQIGFIENLGDEKKPVKLHMAGGEFCGNASRALVFLLHHDEKYRNHDGMHTIRVSGVEHPLQASIDENDIVNLEMPVKPNPDCVQQIDERTYIVYLEGITHVLVYGDDYTNHSTEEAEVILTRLNLKKENAAGVIYVGKREGKLAMNPFVHVKTVGSFFNETSCASGATAVGMVQAIKEEKNNATPFNIPIEQRNGEVLNVEITREAEFFRSVFVSGKVSLMNQGNFSLKTGQQ